jgi:hypothetical protein
VVVTLNVTQNQIPISKAVEDDNSISVSENVVGSSTTVTSSTTASGNVLANDTGLAGDPSTITKITDAKSPSGVTPANGVITIDGAYGKLVVQTTGPTAGNYSYTLDNGVVPPVSATDTFTYTLADGYGNSSTANVVVTLNVTQTQIPILQAVEDDNSISVSETVSGNTTTVTSATTAAGNVLANDKNLSGDPSTITRITDAKSPSGVTPVSGVITIDGTYGTLVVQTTGPSAGNYSYTLDNAVVPPKAGGTDTFAYTLTDAYGNSSTANVVVTLNVTTVTQGSLTISTTPPAPVVIGTGTKMTVSATLAGGNAETGKITFTLYNPSGTLVDTETATVNGNGTYTTPTGYLPTVPGTYQWVASYGGDSHNSPVATTKGATPEVAVGAGSTVVGSTLYLVGGNGSDILYVNPTGASQTGSTGLTVYALLNGSLISTTVKPPITAIDLVGFNGNDYFAFATRSPFPRLSPKARAPTQSPWAMATTP